MKRNNVETEISNDALLELLTLTIITDDWGTVQYFNSDGKLHRVYGPCIIRKNGVNEWWNHGKCIRIELGKQKDDY
jgi:hypothetical protein